ncbi:MAG TPA: ABC transporter permease [Amycolatopsis sp.]|uniref:ABC transporter permease n=1 Tax=Amycolatopsis sp. TaxID=37632 RepID=UPI002B47FA2E|nr:ABC transporter permease [Amycolatopsis sp.]HKS47017.1 ABC transporter permease [Amycolatopsis sp.]
MLGLIGRRLLIAVPLLVVMSLLVFSLVALVPGDPAVTLAGGADASPQAVAQIRAELHLDEPFLARYWTWLGAALRLDFGKSLYSQHAVAAELAQRIPVTASLAIAVFVLVVPLALAVGVFGGLRPRGPLDRGLMFLTSFALSMPPFWVALVLIALFAINLRWLPPFGYTSFTEDPLAWLQTIIMPAVALALAALSILARQVRAGLTDTMQSAFIRTAWAKGGTTRQVVVGHALKNSAIPAVTVMGLQVGAILGGTVIVEQIFSIPGIGMYMLEAVSNKDVPVIQAVTLLFVVANVVANLAVDIAYGYLNPKVRAS